MILKSSTMAEEGALKISKTLKVPVLLDVLEMKGLLSSLEGAHLYLVQGLCKKNEGILTPEDFLEIYADYISFLKKGQTPPQGPFRAPFASVLSISSDVLYSIDVEENARLIKASKPVIQLQTNRITYSADDATFRSQLFGEGGIEWGVQFSYPQLYQDPKTQDVLDVDESPLFPNTKAFRNLQKWIRYNTVPTPFVVEGRRINAPIRLGKECFSWMGAHPDLKAKWIAIYGAS
jgi:hypothetical protein